MSDLAPQTRIPEIEGPKPNVSIYLDGKPSFGTLVLNLIYEYEKIVSY
ncbi:MAG: hypothetical protein ACTSR3_21790 [Candidatus Helarchaeota archaeon]